MLTDRKLKCSCRALTQEHLDDVRPQFEHLSHMPLKCLVQEMEISKETDLQQNY
jgi:hypothetical protein